MKLLHTEWMFLSGNTTKVAINVSTIAMLSEYTNSELEQTCCRIRLLNKVEIDTTEPMNHLITRLELLG